MPGCLPGMSKEPLDHQPGFKNLGKVVDGPKHYKHGVKEGMKSTVFSTEAPPPVERRPDSAGLRYRSQPKTEDPFDAARKDHVSQARRHGLKKTGMEEKQQERVSHAIEHPRKVLKAPTTDVQKQNSPSTGDPVISYNGLHFTGGKHPIDHRNKKVSVSHSAAEATPAPAQDGPKAPLSRFKATPPRHDTSSTTVRPPSVTGNAPQVQSQRTLCSPTSKKSLQGVWAPDKPASSPSHQVKAPWNQ